MKVTVVPSSHYPSGQDPAQYMISYVINDNLAVDAGSLGYYGTPFQQAKIKHVLITHTHADHVASLPIFVENSFEGNPDCVTVHGSDIVLDSIQRDIFNDRIWPDFIKMTAAGLPFLKLNRIEPRQTFEVSGTRVTPIPVDHLVPTLGFLIDDGKASVLIPSDTGPTEEIWRLANNTPNLKAVFLEAAFPSSMERLAQVSKHLTPTSFAEEIKKLRPGVRVFVVHIKARFRAEILKEFEDLKLPNVSIAMFGESYDLTAL